MDKNIPLSALIRIGSKVTPKCRGAYYTEANNATCALGAALVAMSGDVKEPAPTCELPNTKIMVVDLSKPIEDGPDLDRTCNPCHTSIQEVVVELNDHERWTRESIADLCEGLGL